ncbi:MAG: T9SS type A sorting domain-containing protein [Bacteroidetes bacterium]|nr:T9SS type A sorting domain-containing protein [Bacteroidota bacterium]
MDEVSLWNRALQPAELSCLPVNGIDTANAAGLQLYYRFNQGTPGGANTGLTTLTDDAGNINGTLNNFALTGNASNFIQGASLVSPTVAFICPNATYNFNGTVLSAPGVYYDTLANAAGCDSVIQLTLSSLVVDTAVSQNGATLTANHTGTFYQWVDCNNGFSPISGATQKVFNATANGSYAVIVLQGSCYDTSSCYTVTNVGLNNPSTVASIRVYPTASSSFIHIAFTNVTGDYRLQLMDISGRVMTEEFITNAAEYNFDISRFAPGNYQLLLINAAQEQEVFRVVRQ